MDQVIRDAVGRDEFTGSILVARGDEVLLDQGYGLANREWNIPNAGDTKFRLGSVTKQFTAVAIMLLREDGKVDLDAPVKTWLPDAPATWDSITVRHLLAHTSGIADFTRDADFEALNTRPATLEQLIARFRDRPLDFQPGERWSYSNSGYILLTAIIEKASGQSYTDFVTARLLQPLGMTDSGYDTHAALLPRRASGYTPVEGGFINADYTDMTIPRGAGGLYSTTRDLLKWEQGLFGGRVLRPESLTLLTTPVRNDYAFGVDVREQDGHRIVSHSGGIQGFNTVLSRDVDAGLTVVVLGNLNGPGPDKLGLDLMTLAQGGTVTLASERQVVTLSAEALQTYAGVYPIAPTFALTVSVVDGKLMVQATGQGALEMLAEGPDAFFLRDVDARVTFNRDAAGAITGLVLHQGGREMPAPKQ
ncbi:MAG: serine hydrolase [Brevundimonas sp.]|nr:MAG: serine hydrolase [Brevundimonas sp.]